MLQTADETTTCVNADVHISAPMNGTFPQQLIVENPLNLSAFELISDCEETGFVQEIWGRFPVSNLPVLLFFHPDMTRLPGTQP